MYFAHEGHVHHDNTAVQGASTENQTNQVQATTAEVSESSNVNNYSTLYMGGVIILATIVVSVVATRILNTKKPVAEPVKTDEE